jgi:hypothetical protein
MTDDDQPNTEEKCTCRCVETAIGAMMMKDINCKSPGCAGNKHFGDVYDFTNYDRPHSTR